MSALLDHAVEKAQERPDEEQDFIAALILDEIEDDRVWEKALARSPGKLAALVTLAEQQVREGHYHGFDDL